MRDELAVIRPACAREARLVAAMHCSEIGEGFLSSLGDPLLSRLYRRAISEAGSFVLVAPGERGSLDGYVAGTEDVGALYRSFVVRDGMVALLGSAPGLVRSWRRGLETLRHGRGGSGRAGWPSAELLAMAVRRSRRGQGVGRALVEAFLDELQTRQVSSAKVVVAPSNAAAVALYRSCGFQPAGTYELHRGSESQVMIWT